MPTKNTKQTLEDMVRCIDFPHLRDPKGRWLQTGPAPAKDPEYSFQRLCFYARKLRDLAMPDADITCMFSDLYWDAVTEQDLNHKATAPQNSPADAG